MGAQSGDTLYSERLGIPGTITVGDIVALVKTPITDYRQEYNTEDGYVYSGFVKNGTPVIRRFKDNITQVAQGVTDLGVDWSNRLNLTYN